MRACVFFYRREFHRVCPNLKFTFNLTKYYYTAEQINKSNDLGVGGGKLKEKKTALYNRTKQKFFILHENPIERARWGVRLLLSSGDIDFEKTKKKTGRLSRILANLKIIRDPRIFYYYWNVENHSNALEM